MAQKRLIRGGRLTNNINTSAGDRTALPEDASLIEVTLIAKLLAYFSISEKELLTILNLSDRRPTPPLRREAKLSA